MSVIVQLLGGLGNQMFQYAAGRALAHRLDLPLKLDISKFAGYKERNYKLDHFCIQEQLVTEEDLKPFSVSGGKKYPSLNLKDKLRNYFIPWHLQKTISERRLAYDEDFTLIRKSCLLKGYWQCEKYFKNIEDIIREEFQVRIEPDKRNRQLLSDITRSSSVSIHIRRGDYVNNPATNKVHGFLGLKYYEKAIDYFESHIDSPVFFVFSDDIEWAKSNIKASSPVVFPDHNGSEKDYEDLRLMMNCKSHIIANSSFSWWGAWLSSSSRKQVIAPQNWFTKEMMEKAGTIEIVPERWITM